MFNFNGEPGLQMHSTILRPIMNHSYIKPVSIDEVTRPQEAE